MSGQVIRIGRRRARRSTRSTGSCPLSGKVALVTGASRGIGKAIAKVLARDGAHVIGLDVPAARSASSRRRSASSAGRRCVLDITDDDAPARIAEHLLEDHGGVDVVVHNAGVTRDKTLGRMDEERWNERDGDQPDAPQERINDELLDARG